MLGPQFGSSNDVVIQFKGHESDEEYSNVQINRAGLKLVSNKKYRPLDPPLNPAKKLSPLYRFDQTHHKLRNVNSVLILGLCWQRISAFAAGPMSRNKSFKKLQQLFRQSSEY